MTTKSNSKIKSRYLFGLAFILIVVLASILFLNIEVDDLNNNNFGMFGDYFGGIITPFLTFISVLYLIKSINQQSDIIEQNRIEMELTRKELNASADAQKKQALLFELQVEHGRKTDTVLNTTKMLEDLVSSLIKDINRPIYVMPVEGDKTAYISFTTVHSFRVNGQSEKPKTTIDTRFNSITKYIESDTVGSGYKFEYIWDAKEFYEAKLEHLIQMHYCLNTLIALDDIRKALFYVSQLKNFIHKITFEADCSNLALLKRLTEEALADLITNGAMFNEFDIRSPIVRRLESHLNKLYSNQKQ